MKISQRSHVAFAIFLRLCYQEQVEKLVKMGMHVREASQLDQEILIERDERCYEMRDGR